MNSPVIWKLRCAAVDDHAMVVPLGPADASVGRFRVDDRPLAWDRRPRVGVADSTQKNKRAPADVSAMVPGALVLNGRACDALGPFLSSFGQLLALEAAPGGVLLRFYNVTHLVPCVDVERSEKNELGRVPTAAAVFKEPATARSRIDINDPGKAVVDRIIAEAGLTEIECGPLVPSL